MFPGQNVLFQKKLKDFCTIPMKKERDTYSFYLKDFSRWNMIFDNELDDDKKLNAFLLKYLVKKNIINEQILGVVGID